MRHCVTSDRGLLRLDDGSMRSILGTLRGYELSKHLLTLSQASELSGLTVGALRKYIRQGELTRFMQEGKVLVLKGEVVALGRGVCRVCGEPVEAYKARYCSQRCRVYLMRLKPLEDLHTAVTPKAKPQAKATPAPDAASVAISDNLAAPKAKPSKPKAKRPSLRSGADFKRMMKQEGLI